MLEPTLEPGQYRLRFETESYHATQSVMGLYPIVEILSLIHI